VWVARLSRAGDHWIRRWRYRSNPRSTASRSPLRQPQTIAALRRCR